MKGTAPTLKAQPRERLGTRYAQRLRSTGQLPGVVYGHGSTPVAVSVDEKETLRHLHDGQHVFELDIDGTGTETCLVKDLQFGWLGDNVIHIDFARVNLDEFVEVQVSLHFVGEPEAARAAGAILTHDITELTVRCKVRDIPDEIKVDLDGAGDHMTVADLELPAGCEAVSTADTSVCHVAIVTAAEEPTDTDGEGGEPELVGGDEGDEG